MLSKFIGSDSEDTYLFISDFQKVYFMIKLQHLLEDPIKLRFIPFALEDSTKK